MTPLDRQRLIDLGFSSEVIAKTEEVMQLWGMSPLFVTCDRCGKICVNPDLPGRKYKRKKLPFELTSRNRYELLSLRKRTGEVMCLPCDDFEFEYC